MKEKEKRSTSPVDELRMRNSFHIFFSFPKENLQELLYINFELSKTKKWDNTE